MPKLVLCYLRTLLFRLGVTVHWHAVLKGWNSSVRRAQVLHAVGQELAGCCVIYEWECVACELGAAGPSKDLTAVRQCEKPTPPDVTQSTFPMFALQSGSLTLFCT